MSKVAIIGNGNVGSHFKKEFSEKHSVDHYSRSGSNDTYQLSMLGVDLYDFILLAVSDDAIKEVSDALPTSDAVVAHCSGSRPLSDLTKHQKRGVLYPLQTFSKEKEVSADAYTLFIEGSDEADHDLFVFARSFHDDVRLISSTNRAKLHLAAVLVCNFTNHLFTLSADILEEADLSLQDLKPLIEETLDKAMNIGPLQAQTGPAKRKDVTTISKHLSLIKNQKLRQLYQLMTESIQDHAGKP